MFTQVLEWTEDQVHLLVAKMGQEIRKKSNCTYIVVLVPLNPRHDLMLIIWQEHCYWTETLKPEELVEPKGRVQAKISPYKSVCRRETLRVRCQVL